MSSETYAEISIRDVGPITEQTIAVVPGVTILSGGNEAGKSTAIACVAALAGRDVPLGIRDGAKKGIVEGLGTTLVINKTRSNRSGELDADAVEEKIDLNGLVEPKLKSEDAANRYRIKALLSLTGTTLALVDFYSILPEGRAETELLATDADEDPVEMAGKIKRRMDKKALGLEEKATDLDIKLKAKASQYAGIDINGEDDAEKLQEKYTAAVRAHESLKSEREAANKAAEARAAAKKSLADASDVVKELADLEAKLLKAAAALTEANDRHRKTTEKIAELENQLVMERRALESIDSQIEARQSAVESAQSAFEQASNKQQALKEAEELLKNSVPPAPSADDIEAAQEAVDAARVAIEQASKIRDAKKAKAEYKVLAEEHLKVATEAEIFRAAAKATADVLSEAVSCETLKVIEGELHYVEGKRKESFARLSAGRRYQVAICEIAKAVSKGKKRLAVLPLAQEAWDGMEAKTRDLVDATAEERGIAIVTGQIRDAGGELTSYRYKRNGK